MLSMLLTVTSIFAAWPVSTSTNPVEKKFEFTVKGSIAQIEDLYVTAGDRITLETQVSGSEATNVTYKWFIGTEQISETRDTLYNYRVPNISSQRIKCVASNGKTEKKVYFSLIIQTVDDENFEWEPDFDAPVETDSIGEPIEEIIDSEVESVTESTPETVPVTESTQSTTASTQSTPAPISESSAESTQESVPETISTESQTESSAETTSTPSMPESTPESPATQSDISSSESETISDISTPTESDITKPVESTESTITESTSSKTESTAQSGTEIADESNTEMPEEQESNAESIQGTTESETEPTQSQTESEVATTTETNDFSVYISGTHRTIDEVIIDYNKKYTLKIDIQANDKSGIKTNWYEDEKLIKENAEEYELTAKKPTTIIAEATDKKGNTKRVIFYISIDNHLEVYANPNKQTHMNVKGMYPLMLTPYVKASNTHGLIYMWNGTASNKFYPISYEEAKTFKPGEKRKYTFTVRDTYGTEKSCYYTVTLQNYLYITNMSIPLLSTKEAFVDISPNDKIIKVVPANKKVTATFTKEGIKIKSGKTGGAVNVAVKTKNGVVKKFKVTIPKPTLSFKRNRNIVSTKKPLKIKRNKLSHVKAVMAKGDSIVKIVPSNKNIKCSYKRDLITLKAGKTKGNINIAVKTKCGTIKKFKVNIY